MTDKTIPVAHGSPRTSDRIDHFLRERGLKWSGTLHAIASATGRWGLVAILLGFGLYKFTAVEAEAIAPLVSNSPFMGWLYAIGSVRTVSAGIGVTEVLVAALLAVHRWWPKAALLGGLGGMFMFLTTLSFAVTTPGATSQADLLGFLVKDLFLFAASALAASASLRAAADQALRGVNA
jgi:reactive chlorine resistance protein C